MIRLKLSGGMSQKAGPREGRTQGWRAIPMETAHDGKGDAELFLFSTDFLGDAC